MAGLAGVSTNLDLHQTLDPATLGYVEPSYNKLLDYKIGPNVNGLEVVPDLARDWEISDDGRTYTFHLRHNVFWHDIPPVSGRKFTADDVLATFRRMRKLPATQAWQFEPVTNIEAPDDYTVVCTLDQPYVPFLEYLARAENSILPREGMAGDYDVKKKVIGTGPFMVESWERDEQWVRVRHPKYFLRGKPYLDQLNTVIIPETRSVAAALRSSRIDTGFFSNAGQSSRLAQVSHLEEATEPGGVAALYLNQAKEPFTDLRVRRAIAMAINFERMAEIVRGKWQLSSTIPPACGDFALPPEEIKKVRPYNPERSRQLLADAGYANGFHTNLLVQKIYPEDVQRAEFIQQDLKKVGVSTDIEVTDATTAVSRRVDGKFTMHSALRTGNLADRVLQYYEASSPFNVTNIRDKKLNNMIAESRSIMDHRKRVQYMWDIQRYMETEDSSVIYSPGVYNYFVYNSRLQNYYPPGRWADVWVPQ